MAMEFKTKATMQQKKKEAQDTQPNLRIGKNLRNEERETESTENQTSENRREPQEQNKEDDERVVGIVALQAVSPSTTMSSLRSSNKRSFLESQDQAPFDEDDETPSIDTQTHYTEYVDNEINNE
ncbi:hypothetical protein RND71_029409 [Anisodus tanguticus]|uniref:Uncharacterized protein n=1 Tax=Anisodus tanguticus TaxID=243964 RepID=A0AAE1V4J5_9SOLA|nr:hypothetical protein RND71_029409 [Anisodus tanguticus]